MTLDEDTGVADEPSTATFEDDARDTVAEVEESADDEGTTRPHRLLKLRSPQGRPLV